MRSCASPYWAKTHENRVNIKIERPLSRMSHELKFRRAQNVALRTWTEIGSILVRTRN